MSDSEDVLLKRASTGDKEALCQLFEQQGPAVRERIARAVPTRWNAVLTAEDVMQGSYTDAFLEINGFAPDGPDAFRRWLMTIAKNNLRNAIEGLETKKRGGDRHRARDRWLPQRPHRARGHLVRRTGHRAGGHPWLPGPWPIARISGLRESA